MDLNNRITEIYESELSELRDKTDNMFAKLMILQWIGCLVAAFIISPNTWIGLSNETHIHVWAALILGTVLSGFPLFLLKFYKEVYITRYVICISQMMWSALLIHVSGGRIETHFHVFGSLAFISAYRDYKLLIISTVVVAVDHFVRGIYWPLSVYGIINASEWRWLEHAAWVLFEDIFLFGIIARSRSELKGVAQRQAELENTNSKIEQEVEERTAELKKAYEDLEKEARNKEKIQIELLQAEKMASVGSLASGIAHEINTPIQYIGDNLQFLLDEQKNLFTALESCSEELKEKYDLPFLAEEIPCSIKQSMEGISQVANLVKSMKEFAHPGTSEPKQTDINRAIKNVVNVSKSKWKYIADLVLELDENLPEVPCLYGEFNQVLLNIIVNATHAIEDKFKSSNKGEIRIETKDLGNSIQINISDNGIGISDEIKTKIFDLFFTTKDVGRGTGQGLSIAYSLITEKLNGTIEVESELGKGTKFIISLPAMKL